jgi:Ca2+-binding EF-hand superfamily protein
MEVAVGRKFMPPEPHTMHHFIQKIMRFFDKNNNWYIDTEEFISG